MSYITEHTKLSTLYHFRVQITNFSRPVLSSNRKIISILRYLCTQCVTCTRTVYIVLVHTILHRDNITIECFTCTERNNVNIQVYHTNDLYRNKTHIDTHTLSLSHTHIDTHTLSLSLTHTHTHITLLL